MRHDWRLAESLGFELVEFPGFYGSLSGWGLQNKHDKGLFLFGSGLYKVRLDDQDDLEFALATHRDYHTTSQDGLVWVALKVLMNTGKVVQFVTTFRDEQMDIRRVFSKLGSGNDPLEVMTDTLVALIDELEAEPVLYAMKTIAEAVEDI